MLQVYSQISYMPISVPVYACSVTDLTCQLQYTCIYMPAHECQISVVRCQVSLYANLGCYMSNYYISVYMPNAMGYMPKSICKIAICQMLWPCLCLLVWLRNRLDISLYICLLPGYDSPYCRYREEITIIPPGLQFISQSLRYFSMPTYHDKKQSFSMPAYVVFYVPASISYILASISYISGLRYFSLLAHQVTKWYLESQVFQYAGISWQE
jgi:hypothetical protein